jgi:hypothetical protein
MVKDRVPKSFMARIRLIDYICDMSLSYGASVSSVCSDLSAFGFSNPRYEFAKYKARIRLRRHRLLRSSKC